jgi:hypothetical protein
MGDLGGRTVLFGVFGLLFAADYAEIGSATQDSASHNGGRGGNERADALPYSWDNALLVCLT